MISEKRKRMIKKNKFMTGERPECGACGRRIFAWQVRCGDVVKHKDDENWLYHKECLGGIK